MALSWLNVMASRPIETLLWNWYAEKENARKTIPDKRINSQRTLSRNLCLSD